MSLSISNSNPTDADTPREGPFSAIGRALLVCLLLLTAYQGLVIAGRISASDGVGQSENNVIRAQDYAAGLSGRPSLVLVGTSLTANLKAEYFRPGVVNLGLSGGSVRTGLALVMHTPRKPQTLLVEMDDKLSLPLDSGLLGAATGAKASAAARTFPVLREEYRPVGVLVSGLKRWVKSRHADDDTDRDTVPVPPAVRQQLVAETLTLDTHPLDAGQEQALQTAANDVQRDIVLLRRAGVRVVLFDPPGEPAVQSSVRQTQIDVFLHTLFPPGQYQWMPTPPPQSWTTSDGVHLVRADAHRYADFIQSQIHMGATPNAH